MDELQNKTSGNNWLKPISPIYVGNYSLLSSDGQNYIGDEKSLDKNDASRSNESNSDEEHQISYDLADPKMRAKLFEAFCRIRSENGCLKWCQKFGLLDGNTWEQSRYGSPIITTSAFLQAVASINWIKKFACELQKEKIDGTHPFWNWLQHREDMGNLQCVLFRPQEDEIPHFIGIVDHIPIGKSKHCVILTDDQECVASEKKLFDYPLSQAHIEEIKRAKRNSNFTNELARMQPARENFRWLIKDKEIVDIAKEYLKIIFDHLLMDVRPTFSLQSDQSNNLALVPTYQLESPWQSICLSLYEFVAGKSPFRKCDRPNCYNVGDWPKHKHYCADACRKYCERHGLRHKSKQK